VNEKVVDLPGPAAAVTFGARLVADNAPEFYVPANLKPPLLRDLFYRLSQLLLFADNSNEPLDAGADFLACVETVSTRTATAQRAVLQCVSRPPAKSGVLYDMYSLTSERETAWGGEGGAQLSGLHLSESLRHTSNLRPAFGEVISTRLELTAGKEDVLEPTKDVEFSLENIPVYR
jgi:hypothetical protein